MKVLTLSRKSSKRMAKKRKVDSVSEAHKPLPKRSLPGFEHQNLSNESPSNQEVPKQREVLRCPNCNKCYLYEKKFWRHLRSHLHYHPYECKVCLECFSNKKLLQDHQEAHTEEKKLYSCPECSKRFAYLNAMNRHRLHHLESRPYPCPICGAKFDSITTRCMHIKNHIVTCILCKINFQNYTQLLFHIAKVHRSNGTQDGRLVSVEQSAEPIKEKELADSELKFTCFVCEQRFPSEQSMTSHLKAHRLFMCSHCPRFFPYKFELYDHEFEHTGQHPFKCDACQSIFRSRKRLFYHKKECELNCLSIPNSNDNHIMNAISKAVDNSNKVQAEVENAMKNVLSLDVATRESIHDCKPIEKLQREVEHNIVAALTEDLNVSRNIETILSTGDLDYDDTPSLDFNNLLHFHWLVRFMMELKSVTYPLNLDLLKKVLHVESLINLQCATSSGAVSNKIDFLYLMCVQKELSVVKERNLHTLYAQLRERKF